MKISNSKKELAKIIRENGGWREGANWISQDRDGGVYSFSGGRPVRHKDMWCLKSSSEKIGWKFAHAGTIPNWHQTILSHAEYLHLYPAPDADGWIEWKGGDMPVCGGLEVDVIFRCGEVTCGKAAGAWQWGHGGWRHDIIAYRLHKTQAGATDKLSSEAVSAAKIALMSDSIEELVRKPEQAKPEFCESVMRSIPEPEAKPTIEQLTADYRNAKDYAERKQQEADAAKADVDAKLAELVEAGKEHGLLVSPIAENMTSQKLPFRGDDW